MEFVILVIAALLLVQVLSPRSSPSRTVYIPVEVEEQRESGLGCLPLIAIIILFAIVVGLFSR